MRRRPYLDARTMGRQIAGQHAELRRQWQAWGLEHYGAPLLIDTRDDAAQAPWAGSGDDTPVGT